MTENILGGALGLLSILVGGIFAYYGVRAGIVQKEILKNFHGEMLHGSAAASRGALYLVVGLFFISMGCVATWSVIRRMS